MSLVQMKEKPGIIIGFLADSPEEGYEILLNDLRKFYDPILTEQKYFFEELNKILLPPDVKHKTWLNKLQDYELREQYNEYAPCAGVSIQHLEESLDISIPPAREKQKYGIYFNFFRKDKDEAIRMSFKERDAFLIYLKQTFSS